MGAALTNFFTLVLVHLAPPRELTPAAMTSAGDIVFYGSIVVFIAAAGFPIMRDIVTADSKATGKSPDGFGVLVVSIVAIVIWSTLVALGEVGIVKAFLPQQWQEAMSPPKQVKPN